MKRLMLAAVAMVCVGFGLGAASAPSSASAPATRMGLNGRPADTRPITMPVTNTGNWMTRHDGFVTRAKQGDIDLLLQGDSITDGWNSGGKPVWQKEFPNWKMANFGIGGDTCQNIIYRISNGELDGYKAKAIMLMIGTNNTNSYTGEEIGEGVTKIVGIMKDKQPQAKILLLAIFPRGADANDAARKRVDDANKILAKLDGGNVKFLSINDKFLDAQGKLIGFGTDNLHPNAKGYQIWADAVKGPLTEWLGTPASGPATGAGAATRGN